MQGFLNYLSTDYFYKQLKSEMTGYKIYSYINKEEDIETAFNDRSSTAAMNWAVDPQKNLVHVATGNLALVLLRTVNSGVFSAKK